MVQLDNRVEEATIMPSHCLPSLPSRLRDQPDRGQVASPVKSSTFSSDPVVGQNSQSLPDVITIHLCLAFPDCQRGMAGSIAECEICEAAFRPSQDLSTAEYKLQMMTLSWSVLFSECETLSLPRAGGSLQICRRPRPACCRDSSRGIGVRSCALLRTYPERHGMMQQNRGAASLSPLPALHSARIWPCQHQQLHKRSRHRLVHSAANGASFGAPEPSAESLRTPHSGYHWDGNRAPFFEGWYWKVTGRPMLISCYLSVLVVGTVATSLMYSLWHPRHASLYTDCPLSMRHGLKFILLKSTREDENNGLELALLTDRCWGPRRQLCVHIFYRGSKGHVTQAGSWRPGDFRRNVSAQIELPCISGLCQSYNSAL